jgi:DNA-binding GntR family transcriptional regulator
MQIINNLREQAQRFRVVYLKDYSNPKDIIQEHDEIIEAIASRNVEAAQLTAQKHIKAQETAIIKSIKRNELT